MSDIKWIKISTTIFDDEKIKLIESMPDRDSILIIWIKLLTQAGKCNATGHLILSQSIPYTDEMLSAIFNRPLNTVRMALDIFEKFGMIDLENDIQEQHDVSKLHPDIIDKMKVISKREHLHSHILEWDFIDPKIK